MLYLLCSLAAAGLVVLDQWLKWWTVTAIGGAAFQGLAFRGVWLDEPLPLIPHVLGLNFATNTGGAWSMLADHTWLLTLISIAAVLFLAVLLIRREIAHPFGVCALFLVIAGAAGNLIDRVRLGYVVDMFQTLFMDFPIFNVADICVVAGVFALAFYLLFLHDRPRPGKEAPHDHPPADG